MYLDILIAKFYIVFISHFDNMFEYFHRDKNQTQTTLQIVRRITNGGTISSHLCSSRIKLILGARFVQF